MFPPSFISATLALSEEKMCSEFPAWLLICEMESVGGPVVLLGEWERALLVSAVNYHHHI